ncbi:MAG: outer membrane lipoprotein-sorting protein [Armatimonadetes bacterium]|jgi:hypothetical protein|nr:outer membrane lipoprotein-sorting protein [Armatimonadota bacterium]
MEKSRNIACLVPLCVALILLPKAGCCVDMTTIRTAIEHSISSLRSGYGYFAVSYVQSKDLFTVEQARAKASENGPSRIQALGGAESLEKLYWAFDGLKWRLDKRTLVPDKACGGLSQVAWNGTKGTGLTGAEGFISDAEKETRLRALIGVIEPFVGSERKLLFQGTPAYIGDETIDNISVHHFVLRQNSVVRDIWISPQNGYLTKRMRTTPDPGKGRVSVYNVESFRQYDGVWFPETATEISYLDKDGVKSAADVKRLQTLEFHPNTAVPDSVFHIEFPVGTAVRGPQAAAQSEIGGSITKVEVDALLREASVQ